jgi:hypothetical protein
VVVLAISLDMRVGDPADQPGQIAILMRPEDQMPVIGHNAQPQHPAGNPLQPLADNPQKRIIIGRLVKHSRPAIGAVEDMIDNSPRRNALGTAHGRKAYCFMLLTQVVILQYILATVADTWYVGF